MRPVIISQVDKELRPLFKLSQEQGWKHQRTNGNHMKWIPPKGPIVHSSLVINNQRDVYNVRAELIKRGLNVETIESSRYEKPGPEEVCAHGISLSAIACKVLVCGKCDEIARIRHAHDNEHAKTSLGEIIRAALPQGITRRASEAIVPYETPNSMVATIVVNRDVMSPTQVVAIERTAQGEMHSREYHRTMRATVMAVMCAFPNRMWKASDITMQIRGRVSSSRRSEVAYALRMLREEGRLLNPSHGIWCVKGPTEVAYGTAEEAAAIKKELSIAAQSAFEEPTPTTVEPDMPIATYSPTPRFDTPKPPNATAPHPLDDKGMSASPVVASDADLKELDDALEALQRLESEALNVVTKVSVVIRRYQSAMTQLRDLKAFLNKAGI